jgi:hypothetical protein
MIMSRTAERERVYPPHHSTAPAAPAPAALAPAAEKYGLFEKTQNNFTIYQWFRRYPWKIVNFSHIAEQFLIIFVYFVSSRTKLHPSLFPPSPVLLYLWRGTAAVTYFCQ